MRIFLVIIFIIIFSSNSYAAEDKNPEWEKCFKADMSENLKSLDVLSKKEDKLMIANKPTIEIEIERRRLSEETCRKEAQCNFLSSNKERDAGKYSSDFQDCLDLEEKDHLDDKENAIVPIGSQVH